MITTLITLITQYQAYKHHVRHKTISNHNP